MGIESRIYASYSSRQQRLILLAGAMISILTPFTDTVYLPALESVGEDLHCSQTMVALTVSFYLAAVGGSLFCASLIHYYFERPVMLSMLLFFLFTVGQIVWGPLSDYYGRLSVLYVSLAIFEAFTIACIFARDINTLIVLRTVQGFIVGNAVVAVQAIISDVFAPAQRGAAMGAFLVRNI
jgi:MFS transporter, DHA1 family, multidrug resistance protein